MGWFTSSKYPKWLLGIFLVLWAVTFINIKYPFDFFLEHVFTVLFLLLLIFTYRKFRLSNVSYTLIFFYMVLHIIGAHYTYSEVPYNVWLQNMFGFDIQQYFGFQRNHFDRLVHFSFGFLMAYPVREIFMRIANARGFWSYYLPLDVMASFSALYEIVEMGVALILGGDVAQTYNGEQGDRWDAIKDMAFAISGGIIAMFTIFLINWRYKKNFWQDIKKSFAVKRKAPLGEVELQRMKQNR